MLYVLQFISFSKITLRRGYKFDNLPCLTSVLPGDTYDSRNSIVYGNPLK